jgi:hypothetical protein
MQEVTLMKDIQGETKILGYLYTFKKQAISTIG